MTFDGATTCPHCAADLARHLLDVLRKAEDIAAKTFECPACDTELVANVRIVHHIELVKTNG